MAGPSKRDMELLALAAEGMSYKEMADALGVNEHYISVMINRMLKRMGARNKTHAVAMYLKQHYSEVIRELIDSTR